MAIRLPLKTHGNRVFMAVVTALAWWIPSPSLAASPPAHSVVASGLAPLTQLTMTDDDVLLASVTGGGDSSDFEHNCIGHTDSVTCFGRSGQVVAVFDPSHAQNQHPSPVITRLVSSEPDLLEVGGVGAKRYAGGVIYVQMGGDIAPPPKFPATQGKLLYAAPLHEPRPLADLNAFESGHNPDGLYVSSNPGQVLDLGNRRLVIDSAANTILSVAPTGAVSVFHLFVKSPSCATFNGPECRSPVAFARSPSDGDIVTAITNYNSARVVELDVKSSVVERTLTGWTNITSVAVGSRGTVYVSGDGKITKVLPDNTRSAITVDGAGQMTVDKSGNLYVSVHDQIWRMRF